MNVGRIAAIELQDWPHGRPHLLGLQLGRVTGNTQSTESDKRRDDCVVSTGDARGLFLRHGADPIADRVSVNRSGGSAFQFFSVSAFPVVLFVFFCSLTINE